MCITSIDYESYAKTICNWYNDEDFVGMRTVSELTKILDLCVLSPNQFNTLFQIISNKYTSSETLFILQHSQIGAFENFKLAIDVLENISRIFKIKIIQDICNCFKRENTCDKTQIKNYQTRILKFNKNSADFEKIYAFLRLALEDNDQNAFNLASEHGYINVKDKNGKTCLHHATCESNLKLLKYLCSTTNIDLDAKDSLQNTALHYAIQNHDNNCLQYLCSLPNIDVNAKDKLGETILHHSIRNRNLNRIKYICSVKNLNINAKNNAGKTALHYAVIINDTNILHFICSHPNINFNEKANSGMTALHYAAKRRDLNNIKYLLSFPNIDINAKDNDNNSILHYAALNSNVEVIKYLNSTYNLDINAKNN